MSKLKKITGMSTVINPLRKKRWDSVSKCSQMENLHVEQEIHNVLGFLCFRSLHCQHCVMRQMRIKAAEPRIKAASLYLSRPRRFNSSRSTLQMHAVRLLSTQASVIMSIKKLACFQSEFSVVSNKAFIEVFIDLIYIYISIYIISTKLIITIV